MLAQLQMAAGELWHAPFRRPERDGGPFIPPAPCWPVRAARSAQPSPSEPQRTLDRLGKTFGAGAVAPYTILFEGPFTDESIAKADAFLVALGEPYAGPTSLNGTLLSVSDYASCVFSSSTNTGSWQLLLLI